MDETLRNNVARRLASASGHLKGIERMVAEDAYCIDIIRQIKAVQGALTKASSLILENHLRTCVAAAIRDDNPELRERMLEEVTGVISLKNIP